jgi:hypothetical protein
MELSQALIKYQYEEPQELAFKLLPNRLVNKLYCESLSDDLVNAFGNNWERLIATKELAARLPELPGIYMFIWKPFFNFKFDDDRTSLNYIVYIGKAGGAYNNSTLRTRYKAEYSKIVKSNAEHIWNCSDLKTRSDRLNKYLNLFELEYWYLVMGKNNSNVIEKFENKLIKLFNPPANRSGLRAKYGDPQPAF